MIDFEKEAERILAPHEAQFPHHLRGLTRKLIEAGMQIVMPKGSRGLHELGRREGAAHDR